MKEEERMAKKAEEKVLQLMGKFMEVKLVNLYPDYPTDRTLNTIEAKQCVSILIDEFIDYGDGRFNTDDFDYMKEALANIGKPSPEKII